MYYKYIIISLVAVCITFIKVKGQSFDSLHVYAVYMNSMYRVKIDKDLIKNEVAPIVLKHTDKVDSIYKVLEKEVKGKMIKTLRSNHLDIRVSFEFFKKGKVIKIIGLTPQKTLFINRILYSYNKNNLKQLETYIPGLSKNLGVD